MIIVPIGHDKEIFRFPYVTVALMATCLAVQIYSAVAMPSEEELESLHLRRLQLRMELWRKHGPGWLRQQGPQRAAPARDVETAIQQLREAALGQQRFFTDLEAGRLAGDDPGRADLEEVEEQLRRGSPALRWGYRRGAPLYTLITYAFVHGGWLHLIGNLLFLWLAGCTLEDRWGRGLYPLLYLGGAAVAALGFSLIRGENQLPLVGASGAIAATMGAFLVVNHAAEIRIFYLFILVRIYAGTFTMRALWALPLWLGQQLLGLFTEEHVAAVAYSAHVAGFAFGAVAAGALKLVGWDRRLSSAAEERATVYRSHPLFEEGLGRLRAGDAAGARSCFEKLLAESPDHLDAAIELFRLSDATPTAAAAAAGRAIAVARRVGDAQAPALIYSELRQREPTALLDERGLFLAAQALERSEPRAAVEAYQQLLGGYPQGSLAAKSLLSAARLLRERLGERPRSDELLERLLREQPGSPFAEEARRLLAMNAPHSSA